MGNLQSRDDLPNLKELRKNDEWVEGCEELEVVEAFQSAREEVYFVESSQGSLHRSFPARNLDFHPENDVRFQLCFAAEE